MMPQETNQVCLAKALYDNQSESPDELSFRRGDVLTVLQTNLLGLEGWWECELHGRLGIIPANRVQLIAGAAPTTALPNPPTDAGNQNSTKLRNKQGQSQEPDALWKRRSWQLNPDKVMTPQRLGNIYVYDQPGKTYEDYDVPPSRYFTSEDQKPTNSQFPRRNLGNQELNTSGEELYDHPRPHQVFRQNQTQSGNQQSSKAVKDDSEHQEVYDYPVPMWVRDKNSLEDQETYDVPKSGSKTMPKPTHEVYDVPSAHGRGKPSGQAEVYDTPANIYDTPTKSIPSEVYDSPRISGNSLTSASGVPPTLRPITKESGDVYDTPVAFKSPLRNHHHANKEEKPLPALPKDSSFREPETFEASDSEDYDIPTRRPLPHNKVQMMSEHYDVPGASSRVCSGDSGIIAPKLDALVNQDNNLEDETYDYPKAGGTKPCDLPSSQFALSQPVYDVPPQVTRDSAISTGSSVQDDDGGQDMLQSNLPADNTANAGGNTSLKHLQSHQQDVQSACSKLQSMVTADWRSLRKVQTNVSDIETNCHRLHGALHVLVDFCHREQRKFEKTNKSKASEALKGLLEPLENSLKVMTNSLKVLDTYNWSVMSLMVPKDTEREDNLGNIVNSCNDLMKNVKFLSDFMQSQLSEGSLKHCDSPQTKITSQQSLESGTPNSKARPPVMPKPKKTVERNTSNSSNTSVIQERPLPCVPRDKSVNNEISPNQERNLVNKRLPFYDIPKDIGEYDSLKEPADYDYVRLDERRQPRTPYQGYEYAEVKDVDNEGNNGNASFTIPESKMNAGDTRNGNEEALPTNRLQYNDRQILGFYASQVDQQSKSVVDVIDNFFIGVEENCPPKQFISHGKQVIQAAHKMVFMGDTLHRNIFNEEIKNKVAMCSNYLCDCLKLTVAATKRAALQYPSVEAMQGMVDRVVDVSHAANELKLVIMQAAAL